MKPGVKRILLIEYMVCMHNTTRMLHTTLVILILASRRRVCILLIGVCILIREYYSTVGVVTLVL